MTINRTLSFESQDELDELVATVRWSVGRAVEPRRGRLDALANALAHGNAPAGEPTPEQAEIAQLQAQVQTLLADKDELREHAAELARGLTVPADVRVEGESTDLLLHVRPEDMCVWVVLPGQMAVAFAGDHYSAAGAELSARDRAVIGALLQSAQDENTQALRRTRPVTVHTVGM